MSQATTGQKYSTRQPEQFGRVRHGALLISEKDLLVDP
jgi:hypothetical protein